MEYTKNFQFSLLNHLNSNKEFIINKNNVIIDALLWKNVAISRKLDIETLYSKKKTGIYILPETKLNQNESNESENKSGYIAFIQEDEEEIIFIKPQNCMSFFVLDELQMLYYMDNKWNSIEKENNIKHDSNAAKENKEKRADAQKEDKNKK